MYFVSQPINIQIPTQQFFLDTQILNHVAFLNLTNQLH